MYQWICKIYGSEERSIRRRVALPTAEQRERLQLAELSRHVLGHARCCRRLC